MDVPAHFLLRPAAPLNPATEAAFAQLYATAVAPGSGDPIPYTLAAPKWLFLNWLADTQAVLLHGSGNPDIVEFEPRQSNDVDEFGNRQAVYAASDGLWAMYFAIVNRGEAVTSLINACFRLVAPDGTTAGPFYYFSVNDDALSQQPWREGMIYVLPRASFEQQARQPEEGREVEIAQWASLTPVRPLAKLAVVPADFPFLAQVRGHDMALVIERSTRNPGGFPWLED